MQLTPSFALDLYVDLFRPSVEAGTVEADDSRGWRQSPVFIFGSAARGEDHPESDVDFIVEFEGDKSLFDLVGLQLDLEEFLGRDVDVLTEPALSPYLRDRILASASVVYDREG